MSIIRLLVDINSLFPHTPGPKNGYNKIQPQIEKHESKNLLTVNVFNTTLAIFFA